MFTQQVRDKFFATLAAAVFVALASCSGSESKSGDSSNAAMTEAERQEVVNQARAAAGKVIEVCNSKDTFAIQNKMLESRAIQSRYVEAGRKAEAALYDSVFKQTIRASRPDLASEIEQATH